MLIKRLCFISLIALGAAMASLVLFAAVAWWQEERLQQVVNHRLQSYIHQSLPENFQLQEMKLEWGFVELIQGGQLRLLTQLTTPYGDLHMRGPIRLSGLRRLLKSFILNRSEPWEVHSHQDISFDPLKIGEFHRQASLNLIIPLEPDTRKLDPIHFELEINKTPYANLELQGLRVLGNFNITTASLSAELEMKKVSFALEERTFQLGPLTANIAWAQCQLQYEVKTDELKVFDDNSSFQVQAQAQGQIDEACDRRQFFHQGELELVNALFEVPNQELAIALGKGQLTYSSEAFWPQNVRAHFQTGEAEVLWEDLYTNPPIQDFMFSLEVSQKSIESFQPESFTFQIDKTVAPEEKKFFLKVESENIMDPSALKSFLARADINLDEIKRLLPPLPMAGWDLSGHLKSDVKGKWTKPAGLEWNQGSELALKNMKLKHDELRHLSEKIDITLKVENSKQFLLNLQLPSLRQHNIKARINLWTLPLELVSKNHLRVRPVEIPLEVQDLNLSLSPLEADVFWNEGLEYSLRSGLRLPPTELKKLAQLLCISESITPRGHLELTYPQLTLNQNHVYTQGQGQLSVFNGRIDIDHFEIDQFLSPRPITTASSKWENLHLENIGEFTNFGGMVGYASGHMKNVRFTGTLLNEYDFKFQLHPEAGRDKFYFSRRATQNLVDIFAQGQGFNQGPANWLLRTSSRIFGDYGINYAGLRAHTQRNFVLLETFDPPESQSPGGIRYLLHGPRIKMPLSTRTYPVILSKSGWNGFVYYFRDSLLSLMSGSESNKDESDVSTQETDLNLAPPCFDPSAAN